MTHEIPVFPIETPAIRPLEMIPLEQRGQPFLLVRDPLGVIPQPVGLAVDPMLLIVLQLADGQRTIGEMASVATQATGHIISHEVLRDVVRQLDEALLLQSERFVAAWTAKREAYAKETVRKSSVFPIPAAMDRLAVIAELGKEFRRHLMSSISPPERLDLAAGSVQGVLAPHIDYQRGGEVYAWSYKALAEHGRSPDTYFILGVVHRPAMHRFIATRKHFETPFGTVPCDTALLDEFAADFGGMLFEDEYQHAAEHSIELQVVYLKKMLGDRPFKVVPVLVSSFDDLLEAEGPPKVADPEVGAFAGALRRLLEKHGSRVALVGGVDFSHCGPEFGDEELNEPARCEQIKGGDRAALDAIERVDAEAFFDSFRPDFNSRKVCSVGPIYLALDAMAGRAEARVLKYHQANSPDRSCLVSFASVAFTTPTPGERKNPGGKIILLG
ncbi:MAG: AmmeMemoRadiSam system protein B [Candidatus Sumerlaeia bacterium]|nr:AmmeMemoRadiSam system protein B [Candidatus Sumerlaeia bacterium]